MIRAVVLDIGGVLEIIDESVFPAPFLARHGLPPDALERVELPGDPAVGELTERELRTGWAAGLGRDDAGADELMADYWRWYVGTPDPELLAWFARQRPARRTGILSNSSPGAAPPREQETLIRKCMVSGQAEGVRRSRTWCSGGAGVRRRVGR